jgi:hypothetical protein
MNHSFGSDLKQFNDGNKLGLGSNESGIMFCEKLPHKRLALGS